jgi:hypothetical protein
MAAVEWLRTVYQQSIEMTPTKDGGEAATRTSCANPLYNHLPPRQIEGDHNLTPHRRFD